MPDPAQHLPSTPPAAVNSSVANAGSPVRQPRYGLRAGWMMMASGWSANQFSALLGTYRSRLGLSDSAVTGLFAVYVVGLIPGLLLCGPLADRWGRRPVALSALAVNLLSSLLIMAGPWAGGLLPTGRFLTGVSAGALLAAGSAWVRELSAPPYVPAVSGTTARRAGLFVTAGFASGGLAAALIAQWVPHPMVTAYLPHLALAGAAFAAACRAPETRPERSANPHETTAAPMDRRRFLRSVLPMAPWVFVAPTVGFATLPGLVDGELPGWQTLYAGVATAVVPGSGLLVQPMARRLVSRSRRAAAPAGLLVIAAGLALAAAAAACALPGPGLAAGAVLGAGYGLVLTYGLHEAPATAPPHQLARVTAYFWSLAYTGMFAPYLLTLLSRLAPVAVLLTCGAVLAAATCLLHGVLNTRPSQRREPT